MKKTLLAYALALCMAISMLPVAALADEAPQDAAPTEETGQTMSMEPDETPADEPEAGPEPPEEPAPGTGEAQEPQTLGAAAPVEETEAPRR